MPVLKKRKIIDGKDSAFKAPKRQSDLVSGFATQILRSPKKTLRSRKIDVVTDKFEIDDAIEISDEDDRLPHNRTVDSTRSKTSGKVFAGSIKSESLELSQALKKDVVAQNKTSRTASTQTEAVSDLPWLERVPLRKTTDLAVHKKKVADVQAWLEGSFKSIAQKTVLLLTGPAGVGKTATVETLSHVLDFDIIEWKNPMSAEWSFDRADRDAAAESLAQQFERFLSISDKYSALDFGDGLDQDDRGDGRRKVILVEDIPNTFSSTSRVSTARLAFQNSVLRYLTSPRGKYPLILIITETEPRGEDGDWHRSDAMSLRTLLTHEIIDARNCSHISFNEVAPTFISKALARLVDSLPRSEALDISQAVLDEISQTANGDIRSAINTLQFISHRFRTHGRPPKPRRRRKRAEVLTLSHEESRILTMITNRESALGYFHAIGKVIYNKRIPYDLNPTPYDALPDHLSAETRGRPETSAEMILDETSTDVGTFLLGIHQNYIPSTKTLDQVFALVDTLSYTDLLRSSTTYGTIGVMGALHALPQNVKREYSQKVYFPALKSLIHRESNVRDALSQYTQQQQQPEGSTVPRERIGRDLIDIVSYHSLIMDARGKEGFAEAVSFDRHSSLGLGGADSNAALLRSNGDERKQTKVKRRDKKEDSGPDNDEVLDDDDIEEV